MFVFSHQICIRIWLSIPSCFSSVSDDPFTFVLFLLKLSLCKETGQNEPFCACEFGALLQILSSSQQCQEDNVDNFFFTAKSQFILKVKGF